MVDITHNHMHALLKDKEVVQFSFSILLNTLTSWVGVQTPDYSKSGQQLIFSHYSI